MRREYITYPNNLPILVNYVSIKNYPLHWHNSIEILYVLKGKINITIDTDNYELIENELEIINIDESHSFSSSDENNKVLIFNIDPLFFQKYYNDINNMFFYTNTSDEGAQKEERYTIFRTLLSIILCETIQKNDNFDKEIEKKLIDLLFHLINNFHYLTYDNEDIKENQMQLERYHRISKYIFNNYNTNITLQDIANKEFLSTHYLSHEIKYATGYSFTDLINLTRVEESIKLLLDSDESISEICEKIGFSHTRYFNKHFKSYCKMTPLQYRKKYKVTESTLSKQKTINYIPVEESLNDLSYYLDDYDRYNYHNKITTITINANNDLGDFDKSFKDILNVSDAFDLLIEDNKNIVEDILEEINYKYIRLLNMFSKDIGIFPGSKFFNWTRALDILEYVCSLELYPLIVLDSSEFSSNEFLEALKSFLEYFQEVESIELFNFKFQFSSNMDKNIIKDIRILLENDFNLEILDDFYIKNNTINYIYDTTYMIPYIIHNTFNCPNCLEFIKAFDTLDKQYDLTNEVFFGDPGLVNDKGIKKPSYYAYYLLNKMGETLVSFGNGYIVTKSEDEIQILLYTIPKTIDKLIDFESFYKSKGRNSTLDKHLSINILNINSNTKMIKYEINEKVGSSFNYWLSMGKPKRLKKEEKEILHKASFPQIDFKYYKKNTVLNLQTHINGYGAQLILLKYSK
ncbi:helix-turn-helix domain-containing protein [Clostridium tarantellae]|uniref:Helix-turn-helix domain-containing protein n=1 Tax=Clostridium tarantellae TaxID=39493 RepID=A0A6I1MHW5_9CLOT|nr:helix-turn-helix domain-containing protein [Clostridium tarantellae]MPQ43126.1 helix-turn-helix domain-containing protein [Clostridium tarantellae]